MVDQKSQLLELKVEVRQIKNDLADIKKDLKQLMTQANMGLGGYKLILLLGGLVMFILTLMQIVMPLIERMGA